MLWELLGVLRFVGIGVGALLIMTSGILFVVGRSDKAKSAMVLGVVALVAGGYGPDIVSWLIGGEPGSPWEESVAAVIIPRGNVSVNYPLEVAVIPLVPAEAYSVTIDWGDGAVTHKSYEGGQPASLRHVYTVEGSYLIQVNMTVDLEDGRRWEAWRAGIVNVVSPWRQMSESLATAIEEAEEPGRLGGLLVKAFKKVGVPVVRKLADVMDAITALQGAIGLYYGYAFYYYVAMPTESTPGLAQVYSYTQYIALAILGLAFTVASIWRAFWEFERGGDVVLDLFRDIIAAVFGVLAGFYIYAEAARLWNSIFIPMSQLGQLSAVYAMVVSVAVLLSGASIVAPAAGSVLAIVVAVMVMVVIGGLIKWLAAYALVGFLPIAIALWPLPPARPITRLVTRGLLYLFAFSGIASILSYGLSQLVTARAEHLQDLVFALVSGLVFSVAAPTIALGLLGTGPLGGAFRTLASKATILSRTAMGATAIAATAATGGAAAAGLAAAAGPGAPGAPASHLPGPALLAAPMPMRRIELGPPQPPPPGIGMEAHAPMVYRVEPSKPSPLTTIRDYWRAAKGEMEIEPLSKKEKALVAFLRHGPPRSIALFYQGLRTGLKERLGIAPPSPETLAKATRYTGKVAFHGLRLAYKAGTRAIDMARKARMGEEAEFSA